MNPIVKVAVFLAHQVPLLNEPYISLKSIHSLPYPFISPQIVITVSFYLGFAALCSLFFSDIVIITATHTFKHTAKHMPLIAPFWGREDCSRAFTAHLFTR